ncbi:MAG: DUF3100 domain-containing protein [Enterocloster sp.]
MRKKLSDMTKQYSSFFLCVILCCLAAEFIGPIKLSLGRFTVTFLPLLYAMLLMLVLYLAKPVRGVGKAYVPAASRMLSMGVVFAMAKLGISSGASIKEMISASPILILQNIGNIGTVLFALPIALILGMKREAVGMSYALSREPNVALIADMYGSESDEFKGVMVCYIVGTVFGSIFMSVIPPLFVTLGIFRPEAAAMAVGAGSSSMMAAGLAGVIEASPASNPDTLTAFATISNVISSAITVYLGIFITIPLSNLIYKVMQKKRGTIMSEKVSFKSLCVEWVISLTVMVILTMACNIVGYGGRFLESIPGMLILCVISFLGLTAKHFIPSSLPAVTYIGIIGMLAAVPASPVSAPIIYWTGKIDLMASITPILAFAGVLLGKDWKAFLSIGWKGVLVSLLVIFGTFFTSGLIAQFMGAGTV